MKLYTKDGNIVNPRMGVDAGDGTTLYNGTEEEMSKLGYEVYIPKVYVEPLDIQLEKLIEVLINSFDDDYKIIKCYEAQLMNKPMPYNIGELIKDRDEKRYRINELLEQLENLKLTLDNSNTAEDNSELE